MGPSWFKGKTQLFLTKFGTPTSRVNLAEFSEICGVSVVAGDLRKLFTTELKHHENQVLHSNPNAGYSYTVLGLSKSSIFTHLDIVSKIALRNI